MSTQTPLTVQTHALTIPRPGARSRAMAAYLARPATRGPHPGVLVVHELCGFNATIRAVARRLAAAGYVALAMDLFCDVPPALWLPQAIAGVVFRPLNNEFLAKLACAAEALQARPEVDASRLGVMGFSMGSSYALQLACVLPAVRVAAIYYGQNPRPLAALRRACPIVGSYAARDLTTWGEPARLKRALRAYDVPHDIKVYPHLHHGFCSENCSAYDAAAAADAWARTLVFFATHLAPGAASRLDRGLREGTSGPVP